ncbi:MAG: DUF262 domain-containing HNH endonuclease family protein [Paludibacteraceae bacterium]|nr:DUF262 domain-containing HNH endonuclease family protein [Paludibacteraceae bacterium]
MSKLNIDQKSIKDLFSDKKSDFLIPDYQRPYAWDDKECLTLWEDIFSFAFPEDDCTKFNSDNDEYFLGPIVTFKNSDNKLEIIDGQQRLTTLMLLLRAFHSKFGNMKDEQSKKTRELIEKCIWKTDEFGNPNMNALKIDSEVASDEDKTEFLDILRTGIVSDSMKSNYAQNFRFFVKKIDEFLHEFPSYFAFLPIRTLNNCILLPIEAESQDTALRIFSTLNDRGKPLSDADIFKAQFYKYYSAKGQKDNFIGKWKTLEVLCEKIFKPIYGTPMDELFTRYMYYERAKQGIKSSTTEALRKFYEKNGYILLKNDNVFDNLINLAEFWKDVDLQNPERFSDEVLRRLYVLNYAPNGMWTYIVTVYYMSYKDDQGSIDQIAFESFLNKITAFIWAYAVSNPGVNALRTPLFAEMINIVNQLPLSFADYKFEEKRIEDTFNLYTFSNSRAITKSMITWWAYNNKKQNLLSLETVMEIEHIFPRNRQENEKTLKNVKNLEKLGNKAILEKHVNIRASDYKFADKKKYYKGFTTEKGKKKEGTKVFELLELADKSNDFVESNIESRNQSIIKGFIGYLRENDLLN